MNQRFIHIMLLLIVASVGQTQVPQNDNIFDLKNSTSFAHFLTISQQYDLAAIEYERIVFMRPQSDSIKCNLLRSYRLSGKPEIAVSRFTHLYPTHTGPYFIGQEISKSYIAAGDYPGLSVLLENKTFLPTKDQERYRIGLRFLTGNRKQSFDLSQNSTFYYTGKYHDLLQSSLILKRKSPLLAATLSTLVPGLGKVYTNRWKDGLFAAIMIGTIGWRSYRFFDKKGSQSIFGWTFGAVATGFYVGNIWGSYRSAKLYNYQQWHEKEHLMVDYLLND